MYIGRMVIDKKWSKKKNPEEALVKAIATALKVDDFVAKMLVSRGVVSYDQARAFFSPNSTDLHDPFLMKGMNEAVVRILAAINAQQKILFFGDYDVDGTSSVATIYSYFQNEIGYANCAFYIPDRYHEGYGISKTGIDFAIDNEFDLIVSLDCGIKSVDLIQYAKNNNIDFIICDHHLPGESLPPAIAILNPKQKDCAYPFKELCGCGVAFKLMQALNQKIGLPVQDVFGYLDQVAIATCCDIVPMTGENRAMVSEGIKILNAQPRPGIKKLLEIANVRKKLTVEDIVFIIGPRINAAGRIKHGSGAVELLMANAKDPLLEKYAQILQESNSERQGLDKTITSEAIAMIQENVSHSTQKSTVLFNPEWHKGVVGIVASRVIESYYKPTIILTQSNGLITGSARSVKGLDVHAAISKCEHLLENFGGHKYAAGLTLKPEKLEEFKLSFESAVIELLEGVSLVPEIEYEDLLPLEHITEKFFRILQRFAPFGPGNMDPVFVANDLVANPETRVVGENHLKISVSPSDKPEVSFKGIAFKQGHFLNDISSGKKFSIIYNLRENTWNGVSNIELDIKDFKIQNN